MLTKEPETIGELRALRDSKILYVGIGNVLKSDDGVGVYISRKIKNNDYVSSLAAEVSIENYIGRINSLKPDILVIIDCMDMKTEPGKSRLLPLNKVMDLTFNTHNISVARLADFFPMPVFILGIQPEHIDFGEKISYLVKKEADKLINLINLK
ncbi:MAG: hydrogenase maturation protease [Bacteroidales bacterium]|jgi:hydrogenase 3 maturation protease|nr:hydrogenase maturation protease [Bacteroidales bacterium]